MVGLSKLTKNIRNRGLGRKPEPIGQPEPLRRSLLSVTEENFKLRDRKIFVHRLIYIGDYVKSNTSLEACYERIITTVNNNYADEPLTGFLLYYPQYFCVVIDGSEESLKKHFDLLFSSSALHKMLVKLKLLVAYHHANQRFLDQWIAITAKPPTLLENIDFTSSIEQTYKHVLNCIQKLYKLGSILRRKTSEEDEKMSFTQRSIITPEISSVISKRSVVLESNVVVETESPVLSCYPENILLEFLLSSKYTRDLKEFYALYNCVPGYDTFEERVWPIPWDFVPMDVFQKPKDPVTDFPTKSSKLSSRILSQVEGGIDLSRLSMKENN